MICALDGVRVTSKIAPSVCNVSAACGTQLRCLLRCREDCLAVMGRQPVNKQASIDVINIPLHLHLRFYQMIHQVDDFLYRLETRVLHVWLLHTLTGTGSSQAKGVASSVIVHLIGKGR